MELDDRDQDAVHVWLEDEKGIEAFLEDGIPHIKMIREADG